MRLIATLLLALCGAAAQAGPDIYGTGDGHYGALTVSTTGLIVNSYAQVTAPVAPGDVSVTVGSTTGFAAGDLVMIWQATGYTGAVSGSQAAINLSASAVGRWELSRINSVSGSTVNLSSACLYSFAANVTQLVRVPEYTNVTVNAARSIVAQPWDGSTGGIAAFLASGTITNNGQITVVGRGFRAGPAIADVSGSLGCSGLDEAGPMGARKGEGLVVTAYGAAFTGRGNYANGGGGGVCFQSGGGGGGNLGAGGIGGMSEQVTDGARVVGGLGGAAISASGFNYLFMGGGGGAGHNANAASGIGGGVIFIRAAAIVSPGTFSANGQSAALSNAAAGGGGAGGTVYMRFTGSAAITSIQAAGATGGNSNSIASGPGGGGGGGWIIFQKGSGSATLSAVATIGGSTGQQLDPGAPGGSSYGAGAGANGLSQTLTGGLVIPAAPVTVTPANGGSVSSARPPVTGTSGGSYELSIYIDGTLAGSTTADASGNYTFTPTSDLAPGAHTVYAYATYQGLASVNSATNTFTRTAASGPAAISGIQLWLDASDPNNNGTTPANGTAITTWFDKSGNGFNAIANTGSGDEPPFPTYINPTLSTSAISGKATVNFTKTGTTATGYMVPGLDIRAASNPDLTLFTVYRQGTPAISGDHALWGNDDGNWDRFFFSKFGGTNNGAVSQGPVAPFLTSVANAGVAGEVRLLTAVYDGNVTGGVNNGPTNGSAVYFNGQIVTQFTDVTEPTNAKTALRIGYDGGDNWFGGEIAEMLVYNRALSDCEIQTINRYLSTKYGQSYSVPTVSASSTFLCNGSSATLTAASFGSGYTYTWLKDGVATGGSGLAYTASATGSYQVVATASGCAAGDTSRAVTLTSGTAAAVVQPSNITVCAGGAAAPAAFTGSPAGTTFSWTNSNTAIGLAASGTGDIASFTAVNSTGSAITANVEVTPIGPGLQGFAYIPNTAGNTVSVYNLAGNTTTTNITVSTHPFAVAVTPDRSKVYVSAPDGNNVSVISTATNTVTGNSPFNAPHGLAASPDGTRVYVNGWTDNALSYINTSTNVSTFMTNVTNPEGMVVSPDGTKVYVAQSVAPGKLAIVNTATNAKTEVTVGNNPHGVTISPDGKFVYVANINSNSVSVISTATNMVTATITVGTNPHGIAISPDGTKVYVTNKGSNNVSVISTATNTVTATVGAGSQPYGVSVSPDGSRVYVVNQGTNNMTIINGNTNAVFSFVAIGGGNGPVALGNFLAATYTCNGTPKTFTITVNPAPTATVTYSGAPFCLSGTATPTITGTTGGTFSSTTGLSINATTGLVNLAASTAGTYTVTYTIAPANGCGQAQVTTGITVNPFSDVNQPGNQTVCTGATTAAVTFSGGSAGTIYNWTNNTPSIGLAANGSGNIPSFTAVNSGSSPVTATISVAPAGGLGRAYVPEYNADRVAVTDLATNAILTRINVGDGPYGTAILPDGSKIFIGNFNSNTVSVIDPATNTVSATITVGSTPAGMAVSPDGSRLYVANSASASISVISTATNTVVATVALGGDPMNLSISPDGSYVYVPVMSGSVVKISTATNTVTATAAVNNTPYATLVSLDGTKVYVARNAAASVDVLDAATLMAVTSIPSGAGPFSMTLSPDGSKAYVANDGSANISVIATATNTVSATIPVGNGPQGISVSPDGSRVYVLNYSGNTMSVIDAATNTVSSTITGFSGPNAPGNFVLQVGCFGAPKTFTITVNPAPSATISYSGSPFCPTGTATPTITGTTGGAFSATTGLALNTTTGVIDLAGSLAGTYTVTYTIAAANGCAQFQTTTSVTIISAATVNQPGNQTVCAGSSTAVVAFGGSSGATFSWTNNMPSIGLAASGTGDISSFAATNSTGSPVTATVTVTPQQGVSYTLYQTHAGNGSLSQYGQYANSAADFIPLFNTANSNTTILSAGNANPAILLNFTDASQLIAAGIPAPASRDYFGLDISSHFVPAETGVYTFGIDGDDGVDVSIDGTVVASYYGSHGFGGLHTGTVSLVARQVYTLRVRMQEYAGGEGLQLVWKRPSQSTFSLQSSELQQCTGASKTFTITVNPAPSATISYTGSPFCTTGTATPTITGTTGGAFSATTGLALNTTTGVIDLAGSLAGTYTVTYTIAAANSCGQFQTTTSVTINPRAVITQAGNQNVCGGGTTAAVTFAGANTAAFSWTNSNTSIGLGASGNGNLPSFTAVNSGSTTLTATITVNATGGPGFCAATPMTFTISVAPALTATVSYAGSPYCSGPGTAAPTLTGTTGGTFTSTTGLSINATTGAVDIAGSTPGTYAVTYTVTGTGSCPGFTRTASLTINPPVTATITASGPLTICNGGSVTLSAPVIAGATYLWSNGAITRQITVAAAGTFTVAVTANGCVANGGPVTVTVNPTATANPVASQSICNGAPTTAVTFSGTNASSFTWTNNTPSIGLAASGTGDIASFNAVNNGTSPVTALITVTPQSTGGSVTCPGTPMTFSITVNPTPTINTITSQVLCNGANSSAVAFSGGVANTIYSWTNSNPAIGLAASGTGSIASFAAVNSGTAPALATITVTPRAGIGGRAYVPNNGSATVSVVDLATGTTVGSPIPVGANPFGVGVTPDRSRVFVSNTGGNSVSVINTSTNTVIATSPYDTPHGLAASPDGQRMYVSGWGISGGAVSFIPVAAPSTSTFMAAVSNPEGMAVSANGSRLYVASSNNPGRVVVLNTADNSTVATITVGSFPQGVAISPDGTKVYVVNNGSASVSVISSATNAVTATIPVGNNPLGVAVSPDGSKVYVTNSTGNNVSVIDGSTNAVTGTIAVGTYPYGVSVSPDGSTIYVANRNSNNVSIINAATSAVTNVAVGIAPIALGEFTTASLQCAGSPATFTITVNPTPTVNAVTGQTVCNGSATTAISFSGAVTGTAYSWTNSNPAIGLAATGNGNIASFTATNSTPTVQTATITVTPSFANGGQTCTGTPQTFTITVNPSPAVNAVANQTLCPGSGTTAVAFSSTTTGSVFNWTNSNASIGLAASGTGNIASFTATNTTATVQTGTITVTPSFTNGGQTCAGTPGTFTISVNPTPAVNAVANQSVCAGNLTTAVAFGGTVTGAVYSWTNSNTAIGLGASGNGNIAAFTATNGGTAAVTATITVTPSFTNGGQTCTGTAGTFTITVNPLPVGTITAPNGTLVCQGSSTQLQASGGVSYQWFLGPNPIAGATAATLNATQPGVYSVAITNAQGCTANATNTITLTLVQKPAAGFDFNSYCLASPVQFTNTTGTAGSGTVTYQWSFGDGGTSTLTSPAHTYNAVGTYTVALVASPNGCVSLNDTARRTIAIEAPLPGQRLAAQDIVSGRPTEIHARNLPNGHYSWTPATGLSNPSIWYPVATLTQEQEFRIQVSFASGCVTVDTLLVRIQKGDDIFVPTAFSPNGDGANDVLKPIMVGISSLRSFRIFDRLGREVFASSSMTQGWDGTLHGTPLPSETYTWVVEGWSSGNQLIRRAGQVLLVR